MKYKRFSWETNGEALKENIVICGNARFTILTDSLIRMEYDTDGSFTDKASQFAFNRNFPKVEFSVSMDDVFVIETKKLKLKYVPKDAFNKDNISVELKEFSGKWVWGYMPEQLKGTACTLDNVNGEIELEDGVCSRNGYTIVDDSNSYLLSENGWFEKREDGTQDVYFFGYGHNYFDCIADYYKLTGIPSMLPDYAFGNWWSRYYKYNQEEYLGLMKQFKEENIPFSVSVVDMDWHRTETPDESVIDHPRFWKGWTGYSWNKELFPDYKEFLKELKSMGLKTALNLHPSNGIGFQEDMYEEMAESLGVDPKTKKLIKTDVLNPDFMEKYFDILHHPYENDGVDFWWMDWQQGTDYWWVHDDEHPKSDLEGITPLWMLNHLHILDIMRTGKRPMFFSRYCGLGAHRYPVGFSGDTITTWESLDFQPYFTANASNAGYCWWSHDIGGHMQGYRDDELQVRWLQLGVLSPINRLHSTNDIFSGKEPWNLSKNCGEIYKQWLRFRYNLFPYLYTMNYRTHKDLKPLVSPMYYFYPESDNAYKFRNQYFFGSEFFVAPITSPNNKDTMMGSTEVWLPDGLWFDFYNGYCYKGNKTLKAHRNLEEYPVFAKAGAIIPMATKVQDNNLGNKTDMTVYVFPGANNSFSLYEDIGDGTDFEKGEYVTTKMNFAWEKNATFIINAAEGKTDIIPQKRNWKIVFKGFNVSSNFVVKCNGEVFCAEIAIDKFKNEVSVLVNDISIGDEITVKISGEDKIITDNSSAKDRIFDIILHSQINYTTKTELWNAVCDGEEFLYLKCPQKEYKGLLSAVEEMYDIL